MSLSLVFRFLDRILDENARVGVPVCRYESQLESFCKFMDPILDSHTLENLEGASSFGDKMKSKMSKSVFWSGCLHRAASLGQKGMV